MTLVHRVTASSRPAAAFGLGLIRAEADIRPGDWFMVCHFVDDRVMPGTLMYESCLHTLRIFLMRAGWIGSKENAAFEPVPGIANRLKCRGQIVESSRVVTYEVTIKERGYRPEPYAIADALILADGKPIVGVTDMVLQLSGSSEAELEQFGRTTRSSSRGSQRPNRCCSTMSESSHSRSASRPMPLGRPTGSLTKGGSSRGRLVPPTSSSTGSRGSTRNHS